MNVEDIVEDIVVNLIALHDGGELVGAEVVNLVVGERHGRQARALPAQSVTESAPRQRVGLAHRRAVPEDGGAQEHAGRGRQAGS